MKKNIFLFLLLFAASSAFAQNADDSVTICKRMLHDVTVLAHDSMEGRETGSIGELKAARYIVKRFKEIGLKPITEDYMQSFDFVDGVEIGDSNLLVVNGIPSVLNKDFWPLSYAGKASAKGEAVFVQYGITSSNLGYDDYSGLNNLKGKIFVIDLYAPDGKKYNSKYKDFMDANTKIELAIKNGAAGIIFINTSSKQYDLQKTLYSKINPFPIPVVFAKANIAKTLTGKDKTQIVLFTELKRIKKTGYNVIGFIDNKAPITVVIGGHYDHLGWDSIGTGKPAIFNGADDNASGVAGILELAKHYKASDKKESNYLFITFSGEEKGFFGSRYFMKSGVFDINKINYMLNLDMIGRLKPTEKTLILFGTGTSPVWKKILESIQIYGLVLSIRESGIGGSDHVSFYKRGIPVLHFFTNIHVDYHKSTDDVDLINVGGMFTVIKFVEKIVDMLDGTGKMVFSKPNDTNN